MIPGVSEDNLRYQKRFKRRKSTRLLEMSAKERQAEELKIQERRDETQQEKRVIRPIKHSIEKPPPALNSRRLFGHWEVDCVLPFCRKKTIKSFCDVL
uniref:hypothetical protein n=1 Tax=Liquorilactobacillus uvarum TaxID=303240 RepID=UPI00288957BE|nr:hypothetical protein [Liquorilactobacillus uvarum]